MPHLEEPGRREESASSGGSGMIQTGIARRIVAAFGFGLGPNLNPILNRLFSINPEPLNP